MGLTERSFLERMELMGLTTKHVTNYDRIVSKSPEELAEYLAPCACPPIHFDKTVDIDCPVGEEPCKSDCKNCWIYWLKQEAEE
jgi:hypothetical protein